MSNDKKDIDLHFYVRSEKEIEQVNKYFENYRLQKMIVCPDSKIKGVQNHRNKVCRYCGENEPSTTFRQEAHLIPEFLGNHYLIDKLECDKCNELFSKYEDSLAKYLGIFRTINKVKGKRKVPKFNSADKKVSIDIKEFFPNKDAISIERPHDLSDAFTVDFEGGRTDIKFVKEKYIPLGVYKSLVKIGFALLPTSEQLNYEYTRAFLLSDKFNPLDVRSCRVLKYEYPFGSGVKVPMILISKRVEGQTRYPAHNILLLWENTVFQFYLPFHKDDISFSKGAPFSATFLPAIAFRPMPSDLIVLHQWLDLSSMTPVVNEEQSITLQFAPDLKLSGLDLNTNTLIDGEIDPSSIVKIVLVDENVSIPINLR